MTDVDRFEVFGREYQDMVYGTAVRLLGHPAEAEDVAQTVFLRAFERFDEVGASPTVAGWLKTVTTNLCLNHLARYRRRWRFFSELERPDGDGAAPSFAASLPAAAEEPGAGIDAADRAARVEAALGALPAHQRVPLVLFHFEGRSYEDIAVLLGATLSKVKTDIYRGRVALRALLGDRDAAR